MAYNFYPQTYQPMFPTQSNAFPSQMNIGATPPMQNGRIYVQGDAGAKSYLIAPNSEVILWDSESSSFYRKVADQNGVPYLQKFSYTAAESEQKAAVSDYATKEDISDIRKEIDALRAKFEPEEHDRKVSER